LERHFGLPMMHEPWVCPLTGINCVQRTLYFNTILSFSSHYFLKILSFDINSNRFWEGDEGRVWHNRMELSPWNTWQGLPDYLGWLHHEMWSSSFLPNYTLEIAIVSNASLCSMSILTYWLLTIDLDRVVDCKCIVKNGNKRFIRWCYQAMFLLHHFIIGFRSFRKIWRDQGWPWPLYIWR
jgi:hypothetical protein